MRELWFPRLVTPSSHVQDLTQFIDSLPNETQNVLDALMVAIFNEFPTVEVLPVGGYGSPGFHVKYGPLHTGTEYDVCMMIIPMMTKGLRVRVRRNLGENWDRIKENGQRLWQKIIIGTADVADVVQYCRNSCGYQ